jgi:hypothetical protein
LEKADGHIRQVFKLVVIFDKQISKLFKFWFRQDLMHIEIKYYDGNLVHNYVLTDLILSEA